MYEFDFILDRLHPLVKLSFFHHMHGFNATQYRSSCLKGHESQHGAYSFLNETVILFNKYCSDNESVLFGCLQASFSRLLVVEWLLDMLDFYQLLSSEVLKHEKQPRLS